MPTLRAQIITRRTYNRPLEGDQFESWTETVDRVITHQRWLWNRAGAANEQELESFRQLMLDRKVSTSGRTLWLGGTEVARRREASQFNCSFTHVETVYDVVDVFSLLLQGCGVGFRPIVGQLTGFVSPVRTVHIIRSARDKDYRGRESNVEEFDGRRWVIGVGDSADAWAKCIGKILARKDAVDELVIDLSEIRGAGGRLRGYGWISSGDEGIAKALEAIVAILNNRAGSLLTRINILDIVNWLGTTLSSRRSAEIAVLAYGEAEWREFAAAKKEWWVANVQRAQSNNSLLFYNKPSREELRHIFDLMVSAGGSEPGFINAEAALKRAPWFKGTNPCAEILLGNKSFCNLTEVDVGKFHGDAYGLQRAIELAARANYRQTCVDLRDGVLQEAWHLNNSFLRLCGVGLTGIARRPDLKDYDYLTLQRAATAAAYSMADELGTPRPKNITTIKPSGTLSKIMDTTEGVHKPLGRYIFNNVNFSRHDPLVARCRAAGYRVVDNPTNAEWVLVTFPVCWDDVEFETVNGVEINTEPAVQQLDRYAMLMRNWCQQNVSATISYDVSEIPAIVDWLQANWDDYVGVSFLYRTDPTKTARDLGYLYLPQEVVTRQAYEEYVAHLLPIDLDGVGEGDIESQECAGGACPVR